MRHREISRAIRSRRLRSISGGFPDYEQMTVTAVVDESGRYLCKKDHWPTAILVPVVPPGSFIPVPSRRNVYFEDGNFQRPFLMSSQAEREAWPVIAGIAHYYLPWHRVGAVMPLRGYQPWDDPAEEDSSISLIDSMGFSHDALILRTDSTGVSYWADGNDLNSMSHDVGGVTTTNLGAEIIALSLGEYTERSYAIIQIYSTGTGGDNYAGGYADAVEYVDEWEANEGNQIFGQGSFNCLNEDGYLAASLAALFLGDHPAPEGMSTEYEEGWANGIQAQYIAVYNLGYEDGGCSVP